MILGLSIATFTKLHVAISLIGIVSGLVVLYGMLGAQRIPGWTALFLVATVLTSVTGFMFPAVSITPTAIFGAISLVVLAVALLALYMFHAPTARGVGSMSSPRSLRSISTCSCWWCRPSRKSPSCIRWRRTAQSRPSSWRRPSCSSPSCGLDLARCGNFALRRRREAEPAYRPV